MGWEGREDSLMRTSSVGSETTYLGRARTETTGDRTVRTGRTARSRMADVASKAYFLFRLKHLAKDAKNRLRERFLSSERRRLKRTAYWILMGAISFSAFLTMLANTTYWCTKADEVLTTAFDMYLFLAKIFCFGPGYHLVNLIYTNAIAEFCLVKIPIVVLVVGISYSLGVIRCWQPKHKPWFQQASWLTFSLWMHSMIVNVVYFLTFKARLDEMFTGEMVKTASHWHTNGPQKHGAEDGLQFFELEGAYTRMKFWSLFLSWDMHLVLVSALVMFWAKQKFVQLERALDRIKKKNKKKADKVKRHMNSIIRKDSNPVSVPGKVCLGSLLKSNPKLTSDWMPPASNGVPAHSQVPKPDSLKHPPLLAGVSIDIKSSVEEV